MKNKLTTISIHIIMMACIILLSFVIYQNLVTANYSQNTIKQTENKSIIDSVLNECEKGINKMINSSTKTTGGLDLFSDNSLQRYLSNDNILSDKCYTAPDMLDISNEYIHINATQHPKLRYIAKNALEEMAEEFYNNFGDKLYLYSAYRSAGHQSFLIRQGCSYDKCAKVGASEHQLGLAVDIHIYSQDEEIITMGGEYYERLSQHAHEYGFINTYRKGVEIDGKILEPWHWRYVGVELATHLYNNDLSFAEYASSGTCFDDKSGLSR